MTLREEIFESMHNASHQNIDTIEEKGLAIARLLEKPDFVYKGVIYCKKNTRCLNPFS